jgi:inorganic phosphate transporter, PiT family
VNAIAVLVLAAGFLIAQVNGANDVSKGIATLVASGASDYRRAIRWGTLCTALGGLAAATLTGGLVATFGTGLFAAGTTPDLSAALATILGAAAWVLIATRTGLPVSTTHALVGALAGVGAVAYGPNGVRWSALGTKVALPLVLSPLVSLALARLFLRTARGLGSLVRPSESPATLDRAHWFTSGAASFARAMNDAPKMAALVLTGESLAGAPRIGHPAVFGLITLGMVIGSVVGGRRVTHVLAEKVTRLDHQEGFLANLVTAGLVIAGAVGGLPMSTTHVASSAIVGAGAGRGMARLNQRTLRDLVLAWMVTVPLAAALGVLGFALLGLLRI